MNTAPVDTRLALDAADASDMVQKKLSIDAMKKRVNGGGASEEKKLREACEGFESIFLQKMWEQMRKNVKKEGYLHSKDEEAYQSMFDTELSKKMTSAGGIGLADMLYEQLSQKLNNTSKTTGAGALRTPLPIEPAREPKPEPEIKAAAAPAPVDLYSEMDGEEALPQKTPVELALTELAATRDPALDPANATYPMFDLQTGTPMNPVAEKQKEDSQPKREIAVTPLPERVSAPGKTRPSNAIGGVGRSARHARKNAAQSPDGQPQETAASRRMTPAEKAARQTAPAATAAPVAPVTTGPMDQAGQQVGQNPTQHPGTDGGWATSGDMVSSYQNQARSLQDSGRAPFSRIA
ncbi:MAG: hypothetical protein DELT_00971 [Desulfovibrio sp.]